MDGQVGALGQVPPEQTAETWLIPVISHSASASGLTSARLVASIKTAHALVEISWGPFFKVLLPRSEMTPG